MHPDDMEKTAVHTPIGITFVFVVMPYGLKNANQTLYSYMESIFSYLDYVYRYLDDIFILGKCITITYKPSYKS